MNRTNSGTYTKPLTPEQMLMRASSLVEVVRKACDDSENHCEAETLAVAAELIVAAASAIEHADRRDTGGAV